MGDPAGHLEVQLEERWCFLKGRMFFRGPGQEGTSRGPKGAGWSNADEGPALVLEYISFGIWISKTPAFQLLLFDYIDLRSKTPLMLLLVEFLEIFNRDLLQMQSILSPPSDGKGLCVYLE